MTKDEFVKIHGEQLWIDLVYPLQRDGNFIQQCNANAIVHDRLMRKVILKESDHSNPDGIFNE